MKTRTRIWQLGLVSAVVLVALVAAVFAGTQLITKAATPSATLTRYSVASTTGNAAAGITTDQHGDAWFALGSGALGRVSRATGALKVFYLANSNAGPGTIKVDEDGLVWFTAFNIPAIGRLDPATGKETDFVLPSPTLGPDFLEIDGAGNKWFNEVDFSDVTGGKVGRLSRNGTITEWAVPTVGAELEEIGLDSEGNLWFAEQAKNKVGVLNPDENTIIEYTSPTANIRPAGILVAPDDTVWFSEHATDTIAHLFPGRAHGVKTPVTPVVSHQSPGSTSQRGTPGAPSVLGCCRAVDR
jgi:virginiamycin B lyase